MNKSLFVFGLIGLAGISSAGGTNLVINGSFESETNLLNANPGATFGTLGTDPAPDGWTFTASNLGADSFSESNADTSRPYDPATGQNVNAQDGNWYASFGPFNISGGGPTSQANYDSLSQTISDLGGQTYTLSYYVYALGGDGTPGDGSGDYFNITWNGAVVSGTQISDNPSSFKGWVAYTATLTGTGSDVLGLNGYSNTAFVNVDNVSLVAQSVPEPASLAVFAVGLIGLAAFRRRS